MSIDPPTPIPCAWCLSDANLPMGPGSHGICKFHATLIMKQMEARRVARIRQVSLVVEQSEIVTTIINK